MEPGEPGGERQEQPAGAEPGPGGDEAGSVHVDEAVDEVEQESFPSSDPQSSWAGPDRTGQ
jgi:hypothetical protein